MEDLGHVQARSFPGPGWMVTKLTVMPLLSEHDPPSKMQTQHGEH